MNKLIKEYPEKNGIPVIQVTSDTLSQIIFPPIVLAKITEKYYCSESKSNDNEIELEIQYKSKSPYVIISDPKNTIEHKENEIEFFDEIMSELNATTRSLAELSSVKKKQDSFVKDYIKASFKSDRTIYKGLKLHGGGILKSEDKIIDVVCGVEFNDRISFQGGTKAFDLAKIKSPSFTFYPNEHTMIEVKCVINSDEGLPRCLEGQEGLNQYVLRGTINVKEIKERPSIPEFIPGDPDKYIENVFDFLKGKESIRKNNDFDDIDLF